MSETTTEPVKLSLQLKQQSVELDGKPYTIREMPGKVRELWMNSMSARTKTEPVSGKTTIKDFVGMYSGLIARCLYDSDNKPVTDAEISGWPATTQEALFDLCQKINGIGGKDKDEDEGKND